MSSRRPDLTGFSAQKLAAAAGSKAHDPWARKYVAYPPTHTDPHPHPHPHHPPTTPSQPPTTRLLLTYLSYSEAWRYTGPFTRWNRLRGSFPGFGIAVVAFAGYMAYEQVFLTSAHDGHGEGHGHAPGLATESTTSKVL